MTPKCGQKPSRADSSKARCRSWTASRSAAWCILRQSRGDGASIGSTENIGPPNVDYRCRYPPGESPTEDLSTNVQGTFSVDEPSGDLVLRHHYSGKAEGVWGVSWEIANIPLEYAIIVPGRSGVRLTPETASRREQFDYPIGWEAQLVIVEGPKGGFYVWADDTQGRYKRLLVERSASGWRLTLTTLNNAPFDRLTECESVPWHLNVYQGDWRVPARRYREWAEQHFKPVKIEQQKPAWIQDIRCVVIMGLNTEVLEALPGRLDPQQTILYIPSWRAAGYDRDYPVYDQPLEGLRPFVKRAHALGFRVMLHVNYFGVDPLNPLYEQFAPFQVRDPWGEHPLKWWLWTRAEPEIRFAYINPAHAAWRRTFVDAMVKLCRDNRIDSLHLDQTLCIYNDHNGLLEGRQCSREISCCTSNCARRCPTWHSAARDSTRSPIATRRSPSDTPGE